MNRSFGIVFLGILFSSVIVAALALSAVKLLQSNGAFPTATAGAAPQAVVSTNSAASPTIAGTDHPVPVSPPPQVTANPKPEAPNPRATPVPEVSAVVQTDSRNEAESPAELVREKAEEVREKAERLRARVEDLYQSGHISAAAYKQGQAQYQHELSEYENRIAKLRRGATNATGASKE